MKKLLVMLLVAFILSLCRITIRGSGYTDEGYPPPVYEGYPAPTYDVGYPAPVYTEIASSPVTIVAEWYKGYNKEEVGGMIEEEIEYHEDETPVPVFIQVYKAPPQKQNGNLLVRME